MRDIHLAHLDKARPVLILTRDAVRDVLGKVTVAPITTTVKGLSVEVPLGARNGLDAECVASLDNVITIDVRLLGRHVGYLFEDQELGLTEAVVAAYALRRSPS